ncbi:hypothetical protein B484DRAFT_457905 [Ochromonadaceae sp. CCMP2298]|nr:hypothetical protein B484DRAFT_457905 [Ochromonadaceae sp. CCMP2298]
MRFSLEALCLLVCTLLCVCSAGKRGKDKDKGKTNAKSGSDIEDLADQLDAKHLMVVMSHGLSGSHLLCDLVGNVLGTELGGELLGGNAGDMKDNKDPYGQIVRYFTGEQKDAVWAGFKWKPLYYDDNYGKLLQWLGDRGVKMVYNFRNPLDVLISSEKHHGLVHGHGYHCKQGDSKCLDTYTDVRLTLDTHSLLQKLDDLNHIREMDFARAAQFHVPFLSMDYSDFAEGSEANQLKALQKIADFLGVDRQLTLKDLRVLTVSTAPESQADQLINYADVVKILTGTKYQGLLH